MAHRIACTRLSALAWPVLLLSVLSTPVGAQSANEIVGTWSLVSSVTERDGTRTDQFGTGAKGMLVLDAGRCAEVGHAYRLQRGVGTVTWRRVK